MHNELPGLPLRFGMGMCNGRKILSGKTFGVSFIRGVPCVMMKRMGRLNPPEIHHIVGFPIVAFVVSTRSGCPDVPQVFGLDEFCCPAVQADRSSSRT